MKELLFQEFQEVSAKQWKQKIQVDLKGEDYNKKLVTPTLHGISIKPFYNEDDLNKTYSNSANSGWNICEQVYVNAVKPAIRKCSEKLQKGAESLWLIIPDESINVPKLISEIPEGTKIFLQLNFMNADYCQKLNEFLQNKNYEVFLQTDIIGHLSRDGNWFNNLKSDHSEFEKIIFNSSNFESVMSIDTRLYQNAGANIPQQLAYAMAHLTEYLNHFSEISEKVNIKKVQFLVAIGSDYFFEIAKLRALRWLFSTIISEFKIAAEISILAEPSQRNKTLYDYNVNMLRTTTESMSAILGGADEVRNSPYDSIFHKNNEFGDRIARNQLLILKHESYLDKVENPAEGTFYIEVLTEQIAQKALEIFKDIEKGGGFLKQLKLGTVQKKIRESAELEQERFDDGEIILIGTNKFANKEDEMSNDIELFPFLKQNPRKTLIESILPKRLGEKIEKERLESEKSI
ncbi:methylmalonyl-CoA mutase subunit beta [Gramella sp. AN32]|uniref:Methylmalonyl-CoA mutase subunit beta n=1 Tax=Christiangramia antarctica TaxID=2058158 RepID=A0ABW5X7D7_9FLAO|nr:methylmalonyl-CoA mutase subunit beta [Gramella sp. AN32]MCM4154428.1 methylmalonyl-CoA mutase [Gramella sp. AN32]